jgi:hypothetical protein
MSRDDAFFKQINKLSAESQANKFRPPEQQALITAPETEPKVRRPGSGRPKGAKNGEHRPKRLPKQRSTKSIVEEALRSNEGGDYAGLSIAEDDPESDSYKSGDGGIPEPDSGAYRWDEEKAEKLRITPEAFIEPSPVDYLTDHTDEILPAPGFITDFINTSRGMEVPSLFMLWGALWALSSTLARHAWLQWYPDKMWPNIYCVLVALPGLCTKSTALGMARKLVERVPNELPSNIESFEKALPIITGKATGDGIMGSLAPEERVFMSVEDGKLHFVNRGSKALFNISELTTLINKQQYNLGLISVLTKLYDSEDEDSELTRARGHEHLKNIYVTFIGGTTPDHLKTSIPEEALGGGFMSRTVVVYQDIPTKIYPIPKQLPNYPTPDDLLPRLAWIAHNCKGEYVLTPEAFNVYSREYMNWKQRLIDNISAEIAGETRYAIILLKVAMLMRVQEYRLGNDITPQNVEGAIRILSYTLRNSKAVTDDIGLSDYTRYLNIFKRMIVRKTEVLRSWAQSRLSAKGCRAEQLDSIVHQLVTEDYISISLNGKRLEYSANSGKEIYSLTPAALRDLQKETPDEQEYED